MLLKNDNKKFIKTLSTNCLKANRIRNRIALLAIILTALLFTAITTVFQGTQASIREQQLRQSGSEFMTSIKFIAPQKAEELLKSSAFIKAGAERQIGVAVNPELRNLSAAVTWMDETYAKGCYSMPKIGHLPEKENEIACDTEVLKLLGLPEELGSEFTLKYEMDEEVLEKKMTVCGIWDGTPNEQMAFLQISKIFLEKSIDEKALTEGAAAAGAYTIRGSFGSEENIAEQLDAILKAAGYDPNAERGEEGFVVHHVNPAYEMNTELSPGAMAGGAAAILLILLAGYLIIYNIFRISIIKDIRLYGQLKTIGASPKQIRYMVESQGVRLALVGIPAGLVLGWLLGNLLLPMFMRTSNYKETSFIWPNLFVWAASALFTLLTVWISCARPGKIAGKLSPVEALRYQEQDEGKKSRKKGKSSSHRLLSMAYANLGRNKGKTILVVLSVSLSIILLNSALNAVDCFDKETYVQGRSISDFNVANEFYGRRSGENVNKVISPEFVKTLESLPGVTGFGVTYYYELPDEENENGLGNIAAIRSVNGTQIPENSESFIPQRMMMGVDKNALSRSEIVEGNLDYEKLESGNYVVTLGYLNDYGKFESEDQDFHAGDTIEAEIDGEVKAYEVMAVVGIPTGMTPDYSMGGYEMLGFAESTFLKMFPETKGPIHCVFDAEKGCFDQINEYLEANGEDWKVKVTTRLSVEQEFNEMLVTYTGIGMILSLVFAVIGVLNLMNVILTGAIARQGEFATMRSIGMTRKQLRKLFLCEGIFYAVLAGSVGILTSAVLSMTMVKGIMGGFWFAKYRFEIHPAVTAAAVCVILSAVIAYVIDLMWNKGSIVEKLRRVE